MNLTPCTSRLTTLLGTTSLLTTLAALAAHAGESTPQMAQTSEEIPENILITGSLIHGTVAVGVPVTNLTPMDFATTGSPTVADLFRNYPAANVASASTATSTGGHLERENRVNLRGLDATGPRALMMIDGMRYPPQADGICSIDPSIIPSISLDHIDVLADGASATYGSDAISGVINIILRRNYDGAQTQVGFSTATSGRLHYSAAQLWGRTWDGGQITLSFEWYDDSAVKGTAHSNYTVDFRPWGLDDRRPLGASTPGTITTGAPGLPFQASLGYIAPSSCTNCYAVPKGSGANFPNSLNSGIGPLTAAQNPAPLNWATLNSPTYSGANGVQNVVDPIKLGWEDAPQQRTGAVMTVDQRLTKDISFFAEGFYSNRRGILLDAPTQTPTNNVALVPIAVPTFNPYYPVGAPSGLRVGYNIGIERPPTTGFEEISLRYAMGLNIELPASWHGEIHYSESSDANNLSTPTAINRNGVSAALGWTILPVAPSGTAPSFGTWTKPANIPYLNLFCDPYAFQCNSGTTLNYIGGSRYFLEKMWVNEKGTRFDGPLFDLPGGQVKAAVGATYTGVNFAFTRSDNSGAPNLAVTPSIDAEPYNVWATFAQLNVPIFGDANAIPFFRKLEFEASWRHDQYSGTLSGATSNPKVAMNWTLSEDVGLTVKGSWGTSFRFANAGEYSTIASTVVGSFNLPAAFQVSGTTSYVFTCPDGVAPPAGSGAAKAFAAAQASAPPGTSACGTSTVAGISLGGGPSQILRPNIGGNPVTLPFILKPESATNWSGGFELAPTKFLPGLDLQATYYVIKITNVLSAFNVTTTNNFNSAAEGFHYIVPSDLKALNPACATANANPTACAPFEAMVSTILGLPGNSAASPLAQTSIYYINDGGTVNQGSRRVDGIDFSGSYDWDMGNLGAFNTGVVATYYLHDTALTVAGAPPVDRYHQTLASFGPVGQVGVPIMPRFNYRGRLGWSNGPWTLTGFVNYNQHYFHTQSPPPNINGSFCTTQGGSLVGGTFPCAIQNYTNQESPWYSFDLSLGYDTGDDPANDYLKHVAINLVVQDLFDKHPGFMYTQQGAAGRAGAAFDLLKNNEGRVWNLLLTKTW